ncbi:MAG: type II toxin-antitoxin system MqsA family antitoxin [Chloroflexi bacterium]|nr:type II toxin-antitoxin system MqsA family antitoxin [Chloroflexota bacterium]
MTSVEDQQRCPMCGAGLEQTATDFLAQVKGRVFVVNEVPALECPHCGHVDFSQEVARTLELIVAGGAAPSRRTEALVYSWSEALASSQKVSKTGHAH